MMTLLFGRIVQEADHRVMATGYMTPGGLLLILECVN